MADPAATSSGDPAPIDALRGLIEDYDRAAAEVARLSRPDDLGSGERTARLSSLGAWEFQQSRILDHIEALTGMRDIEAARVRLTQ
ncbi:MAG: hypothetical protein AB7G21_02850 [Dehalococcoidia bacterium]